MIAADRRTDPVFIHSSFRVASTWFWNRFRVIPETLSYFEIFNEALSDITRDQCLAYVFDRAALRHPITEPYFLEYHDLVKPGGGVRGFPDGNPAARFVPVNGALSDQEIAYLNGLIAHADDKGRRPVLSSTRSLARIGAIRRIWGNGHIFIYRNLLRHWVSYCRNSERGDDYFLKTIPHYALHNRHDIVFSSINAMCENLYKIHNGRGALLCDGDSFVVFLVYHFYMYLQAVHFCDMTISIDRLAGDESYRRAIEDAIRDQTGVAVDLSDAALPAAGPVLEAGSGPQLRTILETAKAMVAASVQQTPLATHLGFIDGLIEDCLSLA